MCDVFPNKANTTLVCTKEVHTPQNISYVHAGSSNMEGTISIYIENRKLKTESWYLEGLYGNLTTDHKIIYE